jgi:hypothetical protein
VSGGIATLTTAALPLGSDSLSAVFTPANGDYTGSTGTALFDVLAPTTTTLTVSPASPQQVGTAVTLMATVTAGVAGTVQFELGSTDLGSPVAVSGGVATFTTSSLPIGDDSLKAVFTPTSSTDASSTGTASFVVQAIPTSTSLTVSPASPQKFGTAVTLTATVTAGVAGAVQFEVGSSDLGSPVAVSGGVATYTTSSLPAGTDVLPAVFTPDLSPGYLVSSDSASYTVVFAGHSGKGYLLVGRDGGVFGFGDAGFFGSLGAVHLNAPIVGIVATPSGKGYWLVGSDGGVFGFGDAGFFGSLGAVHLNAPVVGFAGT